jgi:hypothetical protein
VLDPAISNGVSCQERHFRKLSADRKNDIRVGSPLLANKQKSRRDRRMVP